MMQSLVSAYLRPGLDREDLLQEASIALWRASVRFDAARGTPFHVYAKQVVRNALARYRRSMLVSFGWQESRMDQTSLEYLQASRSTLRFRVREESGLVRDILLRLPDRLVHVFQLLYEEGYSQREAATRLGLSQPRVSHLNNRLMNHTERQLRKPLAAA